MTGFGRQEATYRKILPQTTQALSVTDVNRTMPIIRCPDCGSAVQITVEHFRNNKPIVCGGCGRVVTLRGADGSVEDRLKEFRAAAEDLDRRTKR